MRRALSLIVATVVSIAGVTLVATPAEAATGVTIKTIKTRIVSYHGTTVVKPSYTKRGSVKVTKAVLTVKKGSSTVARSKKRARLGEGTYRVSTSVSYRIKKNGRLGKTRVAKKSQSLIVRRNCATQADYDSVVTVEMYADDQDGTVEEDFDTVREAVSKLHSTGDSLGVVTLGELRDAFAADGDQEGVDAAESFIDIYGEDGTFEIRDHALCGSTDQAELTYIGGDTWSKEIV